MYFCTNNYKTANANISTIKGSEGKTKLNFGFIWALRPVQRDTIKHKHKSRKHTNTRANKHTSINIRLYTHKHKHKSSKHTNTRANKHTNCNIQIYTPQHKYKSCKHPNTRANKHTNCNIQI